MSKNLQIDNAVDSSLKPVKVDGEVSALEISTDKVKAGDLVCKNLVVEGSTTGISVDAAAPEGTAVLSTGEGGGSKFLREDGDNSCSWQTPSYVTNHITNDAADTMAVSDFGANAALKIDADQPDTAGAEDSTGLHVDYDRAVATSGTAAHNDIGIDLDVNTATLGTGRVKGMDIDVVGATSGDHTAIGIELNVSGAAVNRGLEITTPDSSAGRKDITIYSSADAADYCKIYTTGSGATTIQTVDDGAAIAHLNLTIDGDIVLSPATNIIKSSASAYFQNGWHGYKTSINVMPSEFLGNDDGGTRAVTAIEDDVSNILGIRPLSSIVELYAFKVIPNGYKATHVRVYGSAATSSAITVFAFNHTTGEISDENGDPGNLGTGDLGALIDIADIAGGVSDYSIVIKAALAATIVRIYGAVITIEPV